MTTITTIRIKEPSAKLADFIKKSQLRKKEHQQWMRNNSDKIRPL